MRIGYPCINRTIGCTASTSFRLRSYSEQRLFETLGHNLDCLARILEYNARHGLLFFRISSDLVPFASHPVCTADWRGAFAARLRGLGSYASRHRMRISMHPDQFVLVNALDRAIVERSIRELAYHADVLDSMGLGNTARIQIHVGGVYGDKPAAIDRFVETASSLDPTLLRRLVVENDDRLYTVRDCLDIHRRTGIPVLLDTFHHELNNNGEPLAEVIEICAGTWSRSSGPLMIDYSSQQPGARPGSHVETIDTAAFTRFVRTVGDRECDVMLEIKDKEKSALKAIRIATKHAVQRLAPSPTRLTLRGSRTASSL